MSIKFDVEMVNRVEGMLKSKKHANYVRTMAQNTVKPQGRLYQRNMASDKEADADIYNKKKKDQTPNKSLNAKGSPVKGPAKNQE